MKLNELSFIIEFLMFDFNCSFFFFLSYLDWMSSMFISFVFFIVSMILNYSKDYMKFESNLDRFILLMVMFVFSMFMLVIGMSLVSILVGWDGLGLVSYALVIYYQNFKAFNSGMLTALSNRIGDSAILLSISYMSVCGGWEFYFLDISESNELLLYMLILAAFTKSAQIPFSSWLPAAMAAPTPVSSLVHSSTLVTAGVYLVIRLVDQMSSSLLDLLLVFSLLTMFMSGACANFEYDLKKIVALSTLSQLGMMFVILSLGNFNLAFFHLLIHALFKALLFMCAGLIIHSMKGSQDIRLMGGLLNMIPLTMTCMMISNFALCGLFFISGFYSKDLLVESLSMSIVSWMVYFMFYLSVGLTVSYSIRLVGWLYFNNFYSYSMVNLSDFHNIYMLSSMMKMASLVIFMGSLLSWGMFDIPFFIFLPSLMKLLTILVISLGVILGILLNNQIFWDKMKILIVYYIGMFLGNMWNMAQISSSFNVKNLIFSLSAYKSLDNGWFEVFARLGYLGFINFVFFNISGYLKMLFKASLIFYLILTMLVILYI
uniref:NADH-ubiquinone oxidoreductase chain 5 n=1 Tax=Curculionidae sp. BMNH 1040049 TaxID=1903777 RepID=A0A343A5X0_9CUCU|nr:NADH dehydrogenase subunit 5 [Curculionidae sp. BMNH 1040049]